MEVINDFNIKIDRDKVLKAVSSYYTLCDNLRINEKINNMEELAAVTIKPLGIFKLDIMPINKLSSKLDYCEYIVYSVLTIGDEITNINDKLFDENRFDEAIILDAISTSILFDLSSQFYNEIYNFTSSKNLGLTCRIAPGDGEIDISYQKEILSNFNGYDRLGFQIIQDYMIKPYKSLSYVFGADKRITINKNDHNCGDCNNLTCFMRNSDDKIRGPFQD